MGLNRRVGERMSFAVFLLGNMIAAFSLSGADDTMGQSLDCTTDLSDNMFCEVEAHNCTEYNLTLRSNEGHGEKRCILEQCDNGRCCCTIQMMIIPGETHTATVWRGGKSVGSKNIDIIRSVKPRVPTIVSVKDVNRNFQVMWKTNMDRYYTDRRIANVTYYKKGDTQKKCESIEPSEVNGLNHYEILGRDLEPSTTYVVSVKSYTDWSDRYSDSSQEVEFKTSMSHNVLFLAIIISLSIVAVLISAAIYGCYVKFKRKWWDTVPKCPNPKLLTMHPSEHKILKPVLPVVSIVCVEPLIPDDSKPWSKVSLTDTSSGSLQQSSGISTGSSCLSYANTEPPDIIASVLNAAGKALANISPISPMTINPLCTSYNICGVRADDTSSGSSGLDNRTYSILLPSDPRDITMDSCEVQAQAEMLCDSAYHTSEGDSVICANLHVPACPLPTSPPVVPSLLSTNMSYQQCNGDSGRFSNSEDSSLSSISSGTNTSCDPVSRVEAGCESSDEVVSGATMLNGNNERAIIIDENPCYGTHSFPPMDDDYQPFQNLAEQPSCLFSEKRSDEEEELMSKYPEESFAKMPQSLSNPAVSGFINNVQGEQCLSELHSPFLSLIPADQSMPIIIDSGYKCV